MPLRPNDDTFYIKQGNRVPVLQAQLTDENDAPLNLQFADRVMFKMYDPRTGNVIFERDAVIENIKSGVVQYIWRDGDTDDPGRFRAEFVVRYPGGREESFPNFGYRDIMVWGSEYQPDVGSDVDVSFPAGSDE